MTPLVWTDKMVDVLIKKYPKNTNAEIAKILGVTEGQVRHKARVLKLQKDVFLGGPHGFTWTKQQISLLKKLYPTTKLCELSKQLGIPANLVKYKVNALGLRKKPKFWVEHGFKIQWTREMLNKVKKEFPIRFNDDMAKEMGISVRALNRKAAEMGIKKAPDFLDINRQELNRRLNDGKMLSPNKGWRDTLFKKGQQVGKPFPKGFKISEYIGDERNKLRIERMIKTRNELIKQERARIHFGLPQKTKLRLETQSRRKRCQNSYLRHRGYILDIKNGIAYYNQSTKRSWAIEEKSEYFKFIEQKQPETI